MSVEAWMLLPVSSSTTYQGIDGMRMARLRTFIYLGLLVRRPSQFWCSLSFTFEVNLKEQGWEAGRAASLRWPREDNFNFSISFNFVVGGWYYWKYYLIMVNRISINENNNKWNTKKRARLANKSRVQSASSFLSLLSSMSALTSSQVRAG